MEEQTENQKKGWLNSTWTAYCQKVAAAGVPLPASRATGKPLYPHQYERLKLNLYRASDSDAVPDDHMLSSSKHWRFEIASITCNYCQKAKEPKDFSVSTASATGRALRCRQCDHDRRSGNLGAKPRMSRGKVTMSVTDYNALLKRLSDIERRLGDGEDNSNGENKDC